MNKSLIYLTAITATIFILVSSTAQAVDVLVNTTPYCPANTSTDRYIINADVTFNCTAPVNINVTAGSAIFVNNSYTLDMNGTVLFGNNNGIGIQLGNNSILKNGIIRNYSMGVYLYNSINNSLINNTVSDNTDTGIYLYSGSNNTITNNILNNNYYGLNLDSTSNNIISNNTVSNNIATGIYVPLGSNNTITNNIANNNAYGFEFHFFSNNIISNNTVSNNQHGISFYSSSNNNLTSNIVNNNIDSGIYLESSSSNTLTNNTANNNRNFGIYILWSNSNTLTNNTANNNSASGIWLEHSSSNTLTNNTANNNGYNGIWLEYSSSNTLTNNTAQENKAIDLFVLADFDVHCNNLITNTTGSAGRPIFYYNNSVTLQNQVLSELILCNADNSSITNVTIDGSATLKNNGLFAPLVDGSNLTGINSSNNYVAIYLYSNSNNNTITNNIANNNDYGLYLYYSFNNTITNNIVNNNSDYGFYVELSSDNTISNNTANNNQYGISFFSSSSNNHLTSNTANNNNYGIYLANSDSNTFTNNTANNNQYGILLEWSNSNTFTNNTANNNINYGIYLAGGNSNILTNNTANNNQYGILLEWSNFNNITDNTANNNNYGIYLSLSSSNTLTNNTAQENGAYDLFVEASTDNHCNNLITNTTGSGGRPIFYYNNSVTLQNQVLSELILCNADNSSITNVTIDGSATLKNNGLVAIRVDGSNLTGINSSNNHDGIYLETSNNNTLTSNIVNNNTDYGISLKSSNNNTLTNNTASNNGHGIYLDSSSNSTLTANNMTGNTYNLEAYDQYMTTQNISDTNLAEGKPIYWLNGTSDTVYSDVGLFVCINCKNVTVAGSTITRAYYGVYFENTNNSYITNINVFNSYYGIYLYSGSNNTITNNMVNNNDFGIDLYKISNTAISNNIVNNNTFKGIMLESDSNNNTITNNIVNNSKEGIYLAFNSNNTISNNTINNNNYGIYFYYSKNNTLITNTILNSTQSDFYVDSSSINNNIYNTTLNNSILSFTGMGISLKSSFPIGSVPAGYRSLGKHINITNLSAAGSWIFLNITYSDSDVIGMNESKLSIWRYNSTAWNNWTGVNGVNTAGKYVYANLTNFSIFDVFGLDDIAPTITITSPTSTTYSSSSVALDVSANEPVSSWWYSLDGGSNTTFTPNTILSDLSNGQHTLIVYAKDSVGNIGTASVSFSVNVYIPPTRRGGANVTTNITKETKTIVVIAAGARTNVTITNAATLGIKTISISVKNTVNNVQLTISKTTHPSGGAEVISPLTGKVYKYIEINKSNIQDNDVSSLTISIQVEKTWLTNNNIDEDKVALYRYDTSSNTWTKLITTKTTSDENYVYYDARSPGLSIFAIAGELKQAAAPQEERPTPSPEPQPSAPAAPTDYTWLIIIVVIIIIAGAGYYLYSQGYLGKKK